MRHIPPALVFSLLVSSLAACGSDSGRRPGGGGRDGGSEGSDASAGDAGGIDANTPSRNYCGDSVLEEDEEECDDGNVAVGDGCASDCTLEAGWQCPAQGLPCVALECGDGIVAGVGALGEECDDENDEPGDGCSADCKVEDGWVCDAEGCHETVCGDGVVEGAEGCDDQNENPFDECGACAVIPRCSVGECDAVCGDGMIFPGEGCDDGNLSNGDGCSATCEVEDGWACEAEAEELGATFEVGAVYRDFISWPSGDEHEALRHPDFSNTVGSRTVSSGMVANLLDENGNPVYTGFCERGSPNGSCASGPGPNGTTERYQTNDEASWNQWYRGGGQAYEIPSTMVLTQDPAYPDRYRFIPPGGEFFPLDSQGWVASGEEMPDPGCTPHNFGFTSEVRSWFTFEGGESLTFSGDDDVWVFVGGQLALDLGGIHSQVSATITLQETGAVTCTSTGSPTGCVMAARNLDLTVGRVYEIALFHAERRGCGSNFRLDLAGFRRANSTCSEVCGDGILTSGEECDDGNDVDDDDCSNECEFNVIII